jgi:hypothetical protein
MLSANRLGIRKIKLVSSIGDLNYVVNLAGVRPPSLPGARNAEEVISSEGPPPSRGPRVCNVPVLCIEFSPASRVAVNPTQVVQLRLAERTLVVNVCLQSPLIEQAELFLIYGKELALMSQMSWVESTGAPTRPLMLFLKIRELRHECGGFLKNLTCSRSDP